MIVREKYVPILKCKAGEFIALNKLPEEFKDDIVPVADLVPIQNKKTFEAHIQSSIDYIKKWNQDRLLYIDGYMIQDTALLVKRKKYMEYIFAELRKTNNNVIPVVSNISNSDYIAQIKNIVEKDNRGVCLRIFGNRSGSINEEIERMIPRIDLSFNKIDLLIDLQSLEVLSVDEILNWHQDIITKLIYPSNWRSLVLAGSNFPINLSKLTANQIHLIPRKHWLAWNRLFEKKEIDRFPSYSDYGISHPLLSEVEGIPNASASIRYTNTEEYYIYRGRGTRQHGFEQFFEISTALINGSEYFGRNHCYGDEFIYRCGMERKLKGRLLDWRAVGTNHHITVVVNQLRQFWRDFNAERTS